MLMAHPLVMRELVEQYEALAALAHHQAVGPRIQQQLQDAAFTLCVSTDSQDVDAALTAAREQLDCDFPGVAVRRTAAA
ncbi:DUF5133 domain-containing protein [Streptomyces sp. H39-S7]|uniref:DUF5133 domain-containing protein n=1 Tax=Streptomyces sp. H39-S7 TaxID=3004357 RepID=UPI0022AE917A|nr:DUF5133 domain-containing protein [Streptomyces sp. H39-S7]MCZ4119982.1 DUF5133 domain-containing protein [Streptomyces sp. H39-S7]